MNARKNFAYSLVATAPSPDDSGTSLGVTNSTGSRFPAVPFYAVVRPFGAIPTFDNAEIVLVSARSGDILTITRAQRGSTAMHIDAGWEIYTSFMKEDYDEIAKELFDSNDVSALKTEAATTPVNQVTVKNAATGAAPEVKATGTDTNIDIKLFGKGSGYAKLGNAALAFPNSDGSADQVLKTNGSGVLGWVTPSAGQATYDCTVGDSGADYTSIGAALTAGKKVLYIKGTLTIGANLSTSTNGISLLTNPGDGIIVLNNTSYRMSFTGNDIRIRGVTFDVNNTTNMSNATDAWLQFTGLRISIMDTFWTLDGATTATTGNFIDAKRARQFSFINNHIKDAGYLRSFLMIPYYTSYETRIENNLWQDFRDIACLYCNEQLGGGDIVIVGNMFYMWSSATNKPVVYMIAASDGMSRVVFVGNVWSCSGSGDPPTNKAALYLSMNTGATNRNGGLVFTGNIMQQIGQSVYGSGWGATIISAEHLTFTGNTVSNLYMYNVYNFTVTGNMIGTFSTNGNSLRGQPAVISSNAFYGGITLGGNADAVQICNNVGVYGYFQITLSSSSSNCMVTGNLNMQGGLTVAGSYHVVRNNTGGDANSSQRPDGTLSIAGSYNIVDNNWFATISYSSPTQLNYVLLTDAANIATNAAYGNGLFTVTLTNNRTMDNPTQPLHGQRITYRIKQDGTGSRTLTWGTAFRFPGGTAPTLTTTANKIDYIEFQYDGIDSKWDCIRVALNY